MKLRDLARCFKPEATPVSVTEKVRGATAAFLAILAMGLISTQFLTGADIPIMLGSMGASTLLIFAASHSPMAQPWPVLGGHLISAFVGVSCGKLIPDLTLACATAVALSIFSMQVLHCLHPPGAATTLLAVLGSPQLHGLGFGFLATPVGLNLAVLLPLGILFNQFLGRHYPATLYTAKTASSRPNPKPLERVGFNEQDLQSALTELNAFLDVSREDLSHVYNQASMHAYRRKLGEITCADIMSREVTTAEFGTELEEIWHQMHIRRVKAIPVLDRARRVVGIVTLVDFLKQADIYAYGSLREKLGALLRRTPGVNSDKPEVVGQIMTAPAITIREDRHIVELVPLLSDRGLHHIPVVNVEDRLVGMISQTHLVAALYKGQLAEN